uniref:Pellino 2 n=1 Tax=Mus musculus TaxID=10090 RepID=A0A2I3BRM2_MOUSE
MFSPGQEEPSAPNKEPVKYGELVVLGPSAPEDITAYRTRCHGARR